MRKCIQNVGDSLVKDLEARKNIVYEEQKTDQSYQNVIVRKGII